MDEPVNVALLHDLLDRRVARTPDAAAVTRAGRTWTFAELCRRSVVAAEWLSSRHVRRGDRVLVLDRNDMDTVALVFAASRVGAIHVVVSDRARPYYLDHILADCTPAMVIGRAEAIGHVRSAGAVPTATPDDIPDVERAIATQGKPGTEAVLPTDPVSLIYTSGSTALPKAVVSTHQQVLFAVDAIHGGLGYRPDDVVLCCLPLSFDYGVYQIFLSCVAGSAVVLGDDRDVGPPLLRRLIDERVSILPLVPSVAVNLCRLLERSDHRPARLRMVTNTGAMLPPSLCGRLRALLPGTAVVAMFGLTECKRVSIAEPDLDLVRPGSVGRPLPGTEVLVVDADGLALPPGAVGELLVRGPHVMAGYWESPDLTANRFRRDYLGRTTLHTGDYGRMDEAGYLYFVGRHDDVYKQHGFRISTTEVEAAAMDIPGVELAVALPPDDHHGARLAVSGAITAERLVRELRDRMEWAKVPADCQVLGSIPLNTNGKADRHAVRQRWQRQGAGRA